MSNPALTSILISEFVHSYQEPGRGTPSLALSFIVIPITMSRPILDSFGGTNRSTGLLTWLSRNPQFSLQMSAKVRSSREITSEALSFGIAYGLLEITTGGSLKTASKRMKLTRQNMNEERMTMIKAARALGAWASQLPDAMVFLSLGMIP
jgi:hypothetical protein